MDNMMLQPDPVEEMAVELGLDILDFCINQLEDNCATTNLSTMSDMDIDENEFKVSKDTVHAM
jgi:hypothetical protein